MKAGWATSTQADREQFVLSVLVIAFGEEAISQALASNGSAGSCGCQTIADGIGRYLPGGGIDFNRTASCGMNWSCDHYDASTGTFHDRDDADPGQVSGCLNEPRRTRTTTGRAGRRKRSKRWHRRRPAACPQRLASVRPRRRLRPGRRTAQEA